MRFLFLIAALVCAIAGACIAVDIIDLGEPAATESRYAVGWVAWSFALWVGAELVGDR